MSPKPPASSTRYHVALPAPLRAHLEALVIEEDQSVSEILRRAFALYVLIRGEERHGHTLWVHAPEDEPQFTQLRIV